MTYANSVPCYAPGRRFLVYVNGLPTRYLFAHSHAIAREQAMSSTTTAVIDVVEIHSVVTDP